MGGDLFQSELSSVNPKGLKAFTEDSRLCGGGEKVNGLEDQEII